jgi:hypothetical protein
MNNVPIIVQGASLSSNFTMEKVKRGFPFDVTNLLACQRNKFNIK